MKYIFFTFLILFIVLQSTTVIAKEFKDVTWVENGNNLRTQSIIKSKIIEILKENNLYSSQTIYIIESIQCLARGHEVTKIFVGENEYTSKQEWKNEHIYVQFRKPIPSNLSFSITITFSFLHNQDKCPLSFVSKGKDSFFIDKKLLSNERKNTTEQLPIQSHLNHLPTENQWKLAIQETSPFLEDIYSPQWLLPSGLTVARARINIELKSGDIILQFNGQEIQNRKQLIDSCSNLIPGDTINLQVQREQTSFPISLTVQNSSSYYEKLGFTVAEFVCVGWGQQEEDCIKKLQERNQLRLVETLAKMKNPQFRSFAIHFEQNDSKIMDVDAFSRSESKSLDDNIAIMLANLENPYYGYRRVIMCEH